jgi:hypothetical protein
MEEAGRRRYRESMTVWYPGSWGGVLVADDLNMAEVREGLGTSGTWASC